MGSLVLDTHAVVWYLESSPRLSASALAAIQIAEAMQRIPAGLVPARPDRMIAATAIHLGLPLVTRDTKIRFAPLVTLG